MLVSVGSATNSCQRADRKEKSPGIDPCTELERRAGIWQYSASKSGPGRLRRRSATRPGMRNPLATTIQPGTGALYAAIHGRDQLGDNWGFSPERNAENPAEELVVVNQGDDFGWPYCYYSVENKAKVLAPEYGGDGKEVGPLREGEGPGHRLPGALGAAGPRVLSRASASVRSTRADCSSRSTARGTARPMPQAGYRVVFAPFGGGKATGQFETFATGAGGPTDLRASGLAVGTDGSLYISADQNGKIWKVVKQQ